MFPACPVEVLPTQQLKTGRLFTTGLFAFKYGRLVFRDCPGTEAGQDVKFFKIRR